MKEDRFYLYLILFALLAILVGAALYANWDSFKVTTNETIIFLAGLLKVVGVILVAGLGLASASLVWKLWQGRNVQIIRPGRHGEAQAVLDKKSGVMYLLPTSVSSRRQKQLPEPQIIPGTLYLPDSYEHQEIQAPPQRPALLPTPRNQQPQQTEPSRPTAPEPFDLADLPNWQPSPEKLLLAAITNGLLRVPLDLAWHIILAGPTGHGKSNILRLLLLQLVKYHDVYLINPHYAPLKVTKPSRPPEDWRPIQKYLAAYPDKSGVEIRGRLQWAVNEIDRRATREENGDHDWQEHYIFIAVDEYPEVRKRCPEAPEQIATIVRRGRHYKVILINTSQDMLIKTVGGSSGDRNQYNTVFNVGCDENSARALKVKVEEVPEDDLGIKGLSIIRAKLEDRAITTPGRVPFVSNQALYNHLGYTEDVETSGNDDGNRRDPLTARTEPFPGISTSSTLDAEIRRNASTAGREDTTVKSGNQPGKQTETRNSASTQEIPEEIKSRILAAARTQLASQGKITRIKIAQALGLEGRHFWMVRTVLDEAGYHVEQ